ncbi:hypothetical protein D9M72_580960 [compost metagenome]
MDCAFAELQKIQSDKKFRKLRAFWGLTPFLIVSQLHYPVASASVLHLDAHWLLNPISCCSMNRFPILMHVFACRFVMRSAPYSVALALPRFM